MSMVKEALRTEETKTNEECTVAGIVNSIETLGPVIVNIICYHVFLNPSGSGEPAQLFG